MCVCMSAYLFASLFARLFNHCSRWHVPSHMCGYVQYMNAKMNVHTFIFIVFVPNDVMHKKIQNCGEVTFTEAAILIIIPNDAYILSRAYNICSSDMLMCGSL